jgi:hypothetical protein
MSRTRLGHHYSGTSQPLPYISNPVLGNFTNQSGILGHNRIGEHPSLLRASSSLPVF